MIRKVPKDDARTRILYKSEDQESRWVQEANAINPRYKFKI